MLLSGNCICSKEDILSFIFYEPQNLTHLIGGVSNAVTEAVSLGARAFGLFVRNGRTWKLNPLDTVEAEKFKAACRVWSLMVWCMFAAMTCKSIWLSLLSQIFFISF